MCVEAGMQVLAIGLKEGHGVTESATRGDTCQRPCPRTGGILPHTDWKLRYKFRALGPARPQGRGDKTELGLPEAKRWAQGQQGRGTKTRLWNKVSWRR